MSVGMSTVDRPDGDAFQKRERSGGILRFLFRPTDLASVTFFRIAFGLLMFADVCIYFRHSRIRIHWIDPPFQFTYPGFGWVHPWPGDGMYIHFALLGLLALMVAFGILYRMSITLFFLGFLYVFLLDQASYVNHAYLIALVSFLMIFVSADRGWSAVRFFRKDAGPDWVPAWNVWLLRFQIGLVYFFGGVAKLNSDWLHGEPMRLWLADRTDYFLVGRFFHLEPTVYFFAYGGMLYDLLVVPLLLWRRTRLAAYVVTLFFHLTNAALFNIGIFPWFMIAATTLFFEPDWPRRFTSLIAPLRRGDTPPQETEWVSEDGGGTLHSAGRLPSSRGRHQKLVATALLMCFIIQLLLPVRHFLYPGNVSWHEQGHNFAWHMKLNRKYGFVRFFVTHPGTHRSWTISASDFIPAWQARRMATRPDMILQFAHHLAERFAETGYDGVRIKVGAMAALNGREPQLLIDPDVDLTQVHRSLKPASWILPLREPLPGPPT